MFNERPRVMDNFTEILKEFDQLEEEAVIAPEENGDETSLSCRKIFTDKSDPPIESLFAKYK